MFKQSKHSSSFFKRRSSRYNNSSLTTSPPPSLLHPHAQGKCHWLASCIPNAVVAAEHTKGPKRAHTTQERILLHTHDLNAWSGEVLEILRVEHVHFFPKRVSIFDKGWEFISQGRTRENENKLTNATDEEKISTSDRRVSRSNMKIHNRHYPGNAKRHRIGQFHIGSSQQSA